MVHEGLTLVVSPLIALMKDQVDSLQRIGVRAAYLASSQSAGERQDAMPGAARMIDPPSRRSGCESASSGRLWLDVWLVAVDEAHCISTWGWIFA
ncbi:MAG: hypothetical protein R2849_15985 [Thermomicrobiales bacterium]